MTENIYKPTAQDSLSLQELALWHEIMDYRAGLGLPAIPLSKALTTTAGRHVVDTRENIWGEDLELPEGASLHSWSDATYYADGRNPEAMWFAPDRLGIGYESAGYEISAAGTETIEDTLDAWQDSDGHDAILTNTGPWSDLEFRAIGIGVDTSSGPGPYGGSIFHVWFGEETDATGTPRIRGTNDADKIRGTPFDDQIFGRGGDDLIRGANGDDRLWGGSGDDLLRGGLGEDQLVANGGDDTLRGSSGADRLYGGFGDDELAGGPGADRLVGAQGADLLRGGPGKDTFIFRPTDAGLGDERDEVADFARGRDLLEFQGFGGLDFVDSALFSGAGDELRFDDGRLRGDLDGDLKADFEIALAGIDEFGASDLLL